MARVEEGLDELGDWPELEQGRPMRIRTPTQLGDFDVACLFTNGAEAEIWAGIDMEEDV